MLDLTLAHTYAPVCVCAAKIAIMCIAMYALLVSGVPTFNVHVMLGCFLFIDRTYYREEIFNTNVFSAFVLFSLILNTERRVHNASLREGYAARLPLYLFMNLVWACVGVLALLKAHERLSFLRMLRFDPLVAACALLVMHSFMYIEPENEAMTVYRVLAFLALSISWIYMFHAAHMRPTHVYNATECIVQFGHVLFTHVGVMTASIFMYTVLFALMARRHQRHGGGCELGQTDSECGSDDAIASASDIEHACYSITEEEDDQPPEQARQAGVLTHAITHVLSHSLVPDKPVPDKPVLDKLVSDKPVPDKPVPDKLVPSKPVPDNLDVTAADVALLRSLTAHDTADVLAQARQRYPHTRFM